jgi:hypothetical protein
MELVDGRQETANGVGSRSRLGFGVGQDLNGARMNFYHQLVA